jgi:hypothetical protein
MEQMSMAKMSEEILALKNELAKMKIVFENELEFAGRTEEAWQEIDEGKFTEYNTEEFFEKIKNDN